MRPNLRFLLVACLSPTNSWAFAHDGRRASISALAPVAYISQLEVQGMNPRFMQSKSKLDLMVFVANVFFPSQNPPEYKTLFKRGGCPRWLLDPRRGTPELANDWLPSSGWSYDLAKQTIAYTGSKEAKEPAHLFPFSLFLPRRTSSSFALIKRDFFCQNTQIQSTITLNGAKEAGLVFRSVGERNFWAVLMTLGEGISLVRVKNGERQKLGTIGNFFVQGQLDASINKLRCVLSCRPGNQGYTINVQERIGDMRVTAGKGGNASYRI